VDEAPLLQGDEEAPLLSDTLEAPLLGVQSETNVKKPTFGVSDVERIKLGWENYQTSKQAASIATRRSLNYLANKNGKEDVFSRDQLTKEDELVSMASNIQSQRMSELMTDGLYDKSIGQMEGMLPAMFGAELRGRKWQLGVATTTGLGTAGIAAGVGLVTPIPGDEVVLPIAAGKQGFVTGWKTAGDVARNVMTMYDFYEQSQGSLYQTILQENGDADIAAVVSSIAAVPYAGIEFLQFKTLKGASKVDKALGLAYKKQISNWVASVGVEYLKRLSKEDLEEAIQGGVEQIAVNYAKNADPAIAEKVPMLKDVLQNSIDQGAQAALPLAPMTLLGIPMDVKKFKTIQQVQKEMGWDKMVEARKQLLGLETVQEKLKKLEKTDYKHTYTDAQGKEQTVDLKTYMNDIRRRAIEEQAYSPEKIEGIIKKVNSELDAAIVEAKGAPKLEQKDTNVSAVSMKGEAYNKFQAAEQNLAAYQTAVDKGVIFADEAKRQELVDSVKKSRIEWAALAHTKTVEGPSRTVQNVLSKEAAPVVTPSDMIVTDQIPDVVSEQDDMAEAITNAVEANEAIYEGTGQAGNRIDMMPLTTDKEVVQPKKDVSAGRVQKSRLKARIEQAYNSLDSKKELDAIRSGLKSDKSRSLFDLLTVALSKEEIVLNATKSGSAITVSDVMDPGVLHSLNTFINAAVQANTMPAGNLMIHDAMHNKNWVIEPEVLKKVKDIKSILSTDSIEESVRKDDAEAKVMQQLVDKKIPMELASTLAEFILKDDVVKLKQQLDRNDKTLGLFSTHKGGVVETKTGQSQATLRQKFNSMMGSAFVRKSFDLMNTTIMADGGIEGQVYNTVYKPTEQLFKNYEIKKREYVTKLREVFNSVPKELLDHKYKETFTIDGVKKEFTLSQKMNVLFKQGNRRDSQVLADKNGISKKMQKAIRDSVYTPTLDENGNVIGVQQVNNDVQFALYIKLNNFFNVVGAEFAPVWEATTGGEFKTENSYTPANYLDGYRQETGKKPVMESSIEAVMSQIMQDRTEGGTGKKHGEYRVEKPNQPFDLDLFKHIVSYADNTARFIAISEGMGQVYGKLGSYKNLLTKKFGPNLTQMMKANIDNALLIKPVSTDAFANTVKFLKKMGYGAIITEYMPKIVMTQAVSYSLAQDYVSSKNLAKGFAMVLNEPDVVESLINASTIVSTRYANIEESELRSKIFGDNTFAESYRQFIGHPIFKMDRATVGGIYTGAYMDYMEKNPQGSPEQAQEFAEKVVVRTQPMTQELYRPAYLQSPAGQLFFMFSVQKFRSWSKFLNDIVAVRNGHKPVSYAFKSAWHTLVLPALQLGFLDTGYRLAKKTILGDEPDEETVVSELIKNSLKRLADMPPFLSTFTQGLGNMGGGGLYQKKMQTGSFRIPYVSAIADNAWDTVDSIMNERYIGASIDALSTVLEATGTPLPEQTTIKKALKEYWIDE